MVGVKNGNKQIFRILIVKPRGKMNIQLHIDFFADWIEILRAWLSHMGYSIPQSADPKEIPIIYANAVRRRIRPIPRQIIKSREFSCPPELQSGLRDLEAKVKDGIDINPHLSRCMKKIDCDDALLNDWRVFHFHLGENIENDGFIERTGPLLFARITENSFYEINVYDHGNWTNIDIVEIIHNNWPETIERFMLKDILGLSYVPTSADVKKLRKGQVNSFIQTNDGTIYASIGGGYMTDGTSMEAVLNADQNTRYIRQLEKWVKDNLTIFVEEIKKVGYSDDRPLTIKLDIDASGFYAVCPEYNKRFILNQKTMA